MKLKKLIEGLPIQLYKGGKEIEITGICAHSKRVAPGNLFIVKKSAAGLSVKYIEEAVASGAVAILTNFPNPFLKNIAQLICPDVPSVEGELAARFHNHPSRSLLMIGITGTNGKTTTAYLTKHLLETAGMPCGLISTIEYAFGSFHFPSELTTPDVITNHKLLKEMRTHGCTAAVMEVSSHGLEQKRVSSIEFDIGIFTNLSRDHLDYHGTMEKYAAAKARLFTMLSSQSTAIINNDDAWSSSLVEACPAQIVRYSQKGHADLYARDIRLSQGGTHFQMITQGNSFDLETPLIGKHNVYNCLAAIGVALKQGLDMKLVQKALLTFPRVLGRLEKVDNPAQLPIYVDYAHTPEALSNVLNTLNEFKHGRLIVVFGAGGDRDPGKRQIMGAVANELADYAVVTSDNPRSEDPDAICQEIARGFSCKSRYCIITDRKQAIWRAIELARPQDFVLIAGKGHETYQIFSHKTLPFDDRHVAMQWFTK